MMCNSTFTKQIAFFNANVTKTKSKRTIVSMADSLLAMFNHKTLTDITDTLRAAISVLDLIDYENYGSYMLPNRAICSNLVKLFDKNTDNLTPGDMIINVIGTVSYYFYKNGNFQNLITYYDLKDVYLVEYPITTTKNFYTIENYWSVEQGTLRVDYIMWLNRHFKLILKELENRSNPI